MSRLVGFGILCIAALFLFGFGSDVHTVDTTPVNEAFISPVRDIPPLQAVEAAPPAPINETIPPQPDTDMIWIPGYWSWNQGLSDYVWTTGAWRRPPPGHVWISGKWIDLPEGWVWIAGFWSPVPENQLTYIQKRPPDQIDEDAGTPENSNYFWMPGYWNYSQDTNDYEWIGGRWAPLDRDWVFVPAHYVWTENGYVFLPAYWDWPLDERGEAYSPIYVPQNQRGDFTYEPAESLDASDIASNLLPYYPDYGYYYAYDYLCQPDYWNQSGLCPPWWGWNSWCGLSWSSNWGLWWWYTHPGFHHPSWLTKRDAQAFRPPSRHLVQKFNGIFGPPIIHSAGIFSSNTVLRAGQRAWGNEFANLRNGVPVFPANRTLGINAFPAQGAEGGVFLPTGSKTEKTFIPSAPNFSSKPRHAQAQPHLQNQPVKPRSHLPESTLARSPGHHAALPPARQPEEAAVPQRRSPTEAAANRPRILPPETHQPGRTPSPRPTGASPTHEQPSEHPIASPASTGVSPTHERPSERPIASRPSTGVSPTHERPSAAEHRIAPPRVPPLVRPLVPPSWPPGISQAHERPIYQQLPLPRAEREAPLQHPVRREVYPQLPEFRGFGSSREMGSVERSQHGSIGHSGGSSSRK